MATKLVLVSGELRQKTATIGDAAQETLIVNSGEIRVRSQFSLLSGGKSWLDAVSGELRVLTS